MKKNSRRTRWAAKTERKAYWGMAAGSILVTGFVALVVFGTPVYSLRRIVMASTTPERSSTPAAVHGEPINAASNTALPAPAASPNVANSFAAVPKAMPNPPPSQTPIISAGKSESYEKAGFDRLAGFKFEVSDELAMGLEDATTASLKISEQIPANIKALNEKRVAVTGFMLPLQVRHGEATEFLILKSQMMCCYGITPKMNEWVTVRVAGRGVKPTMDRPVTVYGTMHVGEIRENRLLAGIYRVDADRMETE